MVNDSCFQFDDEDDDYDDVHHQAIFQTNDDFSLVTPQRGDFNEKIIEFSWTKLH